MDAAVRGPSKEEQRNRQHDRSSQTHPHTRFGDTFPTILRHAPQVISFLQEVKRRPNQRSYNQTQERQTRFTRIETMAVAEYKREGFVENVDEAVDEAVVDCGCVRDGFGEEKDEGSAEGDFEESVQAFLFVGVGVADVGAGAEAFFLDGLAHALGFAVEDRGVSGFGEGGDHDEPVGAEDGHLVDC